LLACGKDVDPGTASLPVAEACEPPKVFTRDRAGIGAEAAGKGFLEAIAAVFVESSLAAEPELTAALRGCPDSQSGMACGDLAGAVFGDVVEKDGGPTRRPSWSGVDFGSAEVFVPCPGQKARQLGDRESAMPDPDLGRPPYGEV
jgi:hypothetical protein